jgi:SinI restriction endonuclease
MALTEEANAIAKAELRGLNPELIKPFTQIIKFYAYSPNSLPEKRGKQVTGGVEHVKSLVKTYHKARSPNRPEKPQTVPDPLVSFILENYFNVPEQNLERASSEHQLAMAAENMVGDLLERYMAKILEPNGWIWCAGSVVKSVDFIKPPLPKSEIWTVLQIKNRDNSENSSSSAIRKGTMIEKWFRTFSRTGETNWPNFPDEKMRAHLSEEGFRMYVKRYLEELKTV